MAKKEVALKRRKLYWTWLYVFAPAAPRGECNLNCDFSFYFLVWLWNHVRRTQFRCEKLTRFRWSVRPFPISFDYWTLWIKLRSIIFHSNCVFATRFSYLVPDSRKTSSFAPSAVRNCWSLWIPFKREKRMKLACWKFIDCCNMRS